MRRLWRRRRLQQQGTTSLHLRVAHFSDALLDLTFSQITDGDKAHIRAGKHQFESSSSDLSVVKQSETRLELFSRQSHASWLRSLRRIDALYTSEESSSNDLGLFVRGCGDSGCWFFVAEVLPRTSDERFEKERGLDTPVCIHENDGFTVATCMNRATYFATLCALFRRHHKNNNVTCVALRSLKNDVQAYTLRSESHVNTDVLDEVLMSTYRSTEVCCEMGQENRFSQSGEVKVFDTLHRVAVRRRIADLVLAERRGAKRVYLTGVGGNGKSHNLLRLVMELRDAGHCVAYIHDMQLWLDRPGLLLDEVAKAMRICADNRREEYLPREERRFKPILTNQEWELFPTPRSLLAPLIQMVESFCSDPIHVDKQVILVVDQDNRLFQQMAEIAKKKLHAEAPRTQVVEAIESVISGFVFDAVLLSASANNEGCNRQNWLKRVEQRIEPVPAYAQTEIFPLAARNPEVVALMKELFNNYPLMWHMAESVCATSSTPALDLQSEVETFVKCKLTNFAVTLAQSCESPKKKMLNKWKAAFLNAACDGPMKSASTIFDCTLFETTWTSEGRCLRPMCSYVVDLLREHPMFQLINIDLLSNAGEKFMRACIGLLKTAHLFGASISSSCVRSPWLRDEELAHQPNHILLRPVAGSPYVDCFVVRVLRERDTEIVVELVVVQCTLARDGQQPDSYTDFMSRQGPQGLTPFETCLAALQRRYFAQTTTRASFRVQFLWISDGDSFCSAAQARFRNADVCREWPSRPSALSLIAERFAAKTIRGKRKKSILRRARSSNNSSVAIEEFCLQISLDNCLSLYKRAYLSHE